MNWEQLINKPEPDEVSFTEFSKLSFEKLYTWIDGYLNSTSHIITEFECFDNKFMGWANEIKSAALLIIGNESFTHFNLEHSYNLVNRYHLKNGFTMSAGGIIEFVDKYFNFDGLNNNSTCEIHIRLNNAFLKWASELVNAVMTVHDDFLNFKCMVTTDTLRIIDKLTYTCDCCGVISLECGLTKNSRINFTVCEDCGFRNATILNKYTRGRNQRWRTPLHLFNI